MGDEFSPVRQTVDPGDVLMPFTAGGDSYYLGANDGHHVVVIRSGVQLRIDPSNALDGDLLPSVTEDLTMEELLPLRWKRT